MNESEEEHSGRKLLAVSRVMPPALLPQAIQVPRMLKALSSFGWETVVLCGETKYTDFAFLLDQELAMLFAGAYSSIVIKPPLPLLPLHCATGYKLLRKAGLIDELWQRWARNVALRLMNTEEFHALATFAQPWVDHLVGLEIRRRTGIPWLAHFSDPWVDGPLVNKSHPQYATWCAQEAAVIHEADAVVFTTEETNELVMRKYAAEYRRKAYVVPHGYDAAVLRIIEPAPKNPRLRMVSIGSFYPNRTPMPLLHALEQLNNKRPLSNELEVILAGRHHTSYAEIAAGMGLGNVVSCPGLVPFVESLRLAATGDVLLVIDPPTDGRPSVFLPSKLIDYLMLRKPILGITALEGTSAELLRRVECPLAAPDDIPGIAAAIEGLLEKWRLRTLCVSPAFTRVAQEYEIGQTTRVLDCALQKIVASPAPQGASHRSETSPESA